MNETRESGLERISIKETEVAEFRLMLADIEISRSALNFKITKQIWHDKMGFLFSTGLFEEIDKAARAFISKFYVGKIKGNYKIEPDYQRPVFMKLTGETEGSNPLYDISCTYKIILEKEKAIFKGELPFGD